MMNEEDEAFNEIERRAKQRKEAVRAAMQTLTEYERGYEDGVAKEREAVVQMVEPWLLPEYVEKIRARGQA